MRFSNVFGLLLGLGACVEPLSREQWDAYVAQADASGFLRTDRAAEDVPLSSDLLAENFEKIAFSFEKAPFGLPQSGRVADGMIRKWTEPVVYTIDGPKEILPSVVPRIDRFMKRLSEVTGHEFVRPEITSPLEPGWKPANFSILYGDEAYFRYISRGLIQTNRSVQRLVYRWRNSHSPCGGGIGRDPARDGFSETGRIRTVVVLIRHEIPEKLLRVCVEEELSQSMGLFNDDMTVRPSIFNDDQEFALLTEHDMDLLRILYDPRLSVGMSRARAMPIVRRIAQELRPDE